MKSFLPEDEEVELLNFMRQQEEMLQNNEKNEEMKEWAEEED